MLGAEWAKKLSDRKLHFKAPVLASRVPYVSESDGVEWNIETSDIEQLDFGLSNLCSDASVPYVSVLGKLSKCNDYIAGLDANDGLHTNASGYAAEDELIMQDPVWAKFVG